jgi:DNA-binding transcriptional ArsR family regulator
MEVLDDLALNQVADHFRAMSEPQRLKLLQALRGGPRNVGDLTQLLQCSQANVSKHLGLLAKVGLVQREARGTSVYYRIADARTFELCDLVCGQIAQRLMSQARTLGAFDPAPARATGARTTPAKASKAVKVLKALKAAGPVKASKPAKTGKGSAR